jgi:1,2-diacylglycerol 3-beta-galactosyltransferase
MDANDDQNAPRRVLMLIGHTGGGHLRAAQAVREALHRRHGGQVTVDIVDALGEYGPWPFNRLADLYPWWINHAACTWGWGYAATDAPRRATALLRLFWPRVWPGTRRLLLDRPAAAIVSIHPLTNHYLVWGLRRLGRRVPVVTLVTDPISVHPFWLAPGVTRCLVGSDAARRQALRSGLQPERIRVTGLPVSPCFVEGLAPKEEARRSLGLAPGRPVVLLIGGGAGIGDLYETARAIDARCTALQLAVVTGRNQELRQRLEAVRWRVPVQVRGFVDRSGEVARLMCAADLLVTKAGPGTLHEAFLAGLPLILNGAVPGQEEGNVRLVVEAGAGVWGSSPGEVANLVASWTRPGAPALARMSARSRLLARPHAADGAAREISDLALTNL